MSKTALVAGGTGGVGVAVAARLRAKGWRVLAAGRSADAEVTLDLTNASSIEGARRDVADLVGTQGLQGLVNAAGMSVDGPVELVSPAGWRRQFEVNLVGQVALTQALLPLLRAGGGRIVNVGGAAGRLPLPMYGPLSASKAALDAATAALRMELRPECIPVSYIEPGALRTSFFSASAAAADEGEWLLNGEATERYNNAIEAAGEAVANLRASSADAAAKAVSKALNARRPRARYVVGVDTRAALALLPVLPNRLRETVLARSVGLSTRGVH